MSSEIWTSIVKATRVTFVQKERAAAAFEFDRVEFLADGVFPRVEV
jgi:hypothetical protein